MQDQNSYSHHAKRLTSLGLPLIGGYVAGFAIHMADTIMLGWYSVEALAAGVLGSSFFFVLFILGSGFGQAVMPVVASAVSAGEERQVRRVTRMAMWQSILYGLIVLPLFLFAGPILARLGQPEDVAVLAGDYLAIAGFGMVPAVLVQVLRSYLSALERAGVVLWVTLIALAGNVIINYALIFGNWGFPEMGIRGAAIASIFVQVVSTLGLILYALRLFPDHALLQRFWRPDWEAFRNIFALGWPISLTALAEVALFNSTALMMGWIGTIYIAAHGVALQIAAVFFLVHMGLAQAGTIRVGQAHGRHDMLAVQRISIASNVLSLIFAAVAIVIYLSVPEFMIGLFISPDDPDRPQVLLVGVSLLAVAALFQLADAGQVQALSLLRGLQDTRVPMIFATISYWVIGAPAAYLLGFPLGWGGVGIWLGLTLGLTAAWVLLGLRLWRLAFRAPAEN